MSVVTVKNFTYNTQDLIGKGATGSVYKGVDSYNGRTVAIKTIKMSSVNNDVTKYLLQNELKALQTVDHPNIVKNYDVIRNKDYTYIVMEYCPLNFNKYIKSQIEVIPEDRVMELFSQIVEGYKCLRDNKIVHRDLKPSNILLTSEWIPKISDFGYCQIEGFLPKPKMFYNVGSPSYMPPEAISKNIYSQKSDIWALGAILYEMVNGQTFDKGKQVMQAIRDIIKRGITHVRQVRPQIQAIIKQCLNPDQAKRATLTRLRDLLHLEHSGVRNTSFYRDDSVLQQQSFAFGHQKSIIKPLQNQNSFFDHQPVSQVPVPPFGPVMKSYVVRNSHRQSQPQQHHQIQQVVHTVPTLNIKRSFINQQHQQQQQSPQITHNQSPQSNIHQILQNHQVKTSVSTNLQSIIPQPINQQVKPSVSQLSQMDRQRNNIIHVARRSQLEQSQPEKRYFSVSPRKQQKQQQQQAFTKRNIAHLNTSIDQIMPMTIQSQRGTLVRQRL